MRKEIKSIGLTMLTIVGVLSSCSNKNAVNGPELKDMEACQFLSGAEAMHGSIGKSWVLDKGHYVFPYLKFYSDFKMDDNILNEASELKLTFYTEGDALKVFDKTTSNVQEFAFKILRISNDSLFLRRETACSDTLYYCNSDTLIYVNAEKSGTNKGFSFNEEKWLKGIKGTIWESHTLANSTERISYTFLNDGKAINNVTGQEEGGLNRVKEFDKKSEAGYGKIDYYFVNPCLINCKLKDTIVLLHYKEEKK